MRRLYGIVYFLFCPYGTNRREICQQWSNETKYIYSMTELNKTFEVVENKIKFPFYATDFFFLEIFHNFLYYYTLEFTQNTHIQCTVE